MNTDNWYNRVIEIKCFGIGLLYIETSKINRTIETTRRSFETNQENIDFIKTQGERGEADFSAAQTWFGRNR